MLSASKSSIVQALPADIYRFPATIDVLAALTAAGFAIESIDERDEIGGLEPMFEALPASGAGLPHQGGPPDKLEFRRLWSARLADLTGA